MNIELAKLCCRASAYGYDRMVGVAAHPANLLAIDERLIEVDTSAVLVLEFVERRLIVFPGTQSEWAFLREPIKTWESIRDWVRNIQFSLTSGAALGVPGRLHRGFCEELQRVLPQLTDELNGRSALLGAKPIVLTGHSQGGAIAAIATAALPVVGIAVDESFTFAAPRPGDRGFSEAVKLSETPVWRMEYGNDIVPHLPLRRGQVMLDFHPVGQLVYGRPNNHTVIVTDSGELTREVRRQRMLANQNDWIEHHHLPHYRQLLEDLP